MAQAEYLAMEPQFTAYDRITLNVSPRFLKAQLQVKARKLAQLEAEYGKMVKMKQAEPAICALHRIGLGYSQFAQALYDNPIPREVKAIGKEGLDEYRAQLAQVAEPLEKKAVEGYQLAVNASRDYGVTNSCSREAVQALRKAKPEAVEALHRGGAPAGRGAGGRPAGRLRPAPRAAGAGGAPPGRRPGDAGAAGPQGPRHQAAGHAATNDPQKRKPDPDQPIPPRRKGAGDDEDLLP